VHSRYSDEKTKPVHGEQTGSLTFNEIGPRTESCLSYSQRCAIEFNGNSPLRDARYEETSAIRNTAIPCDNWNFFSKLTQKLMEHIMRRVSFNVRFCYRRKRGCWKKFAFLVITTVFNTCNAIDHTFYIHKESGLIINNVSVCTRHSLNVSCVYTTTLDFELIRIQNGIQISRGLDFLNYTDACLHHRTKRQRTFSVNRTARYFGADIDGDSNTATGQ